MLRYTSTISDPYPLSPNTTSGNIIVTYPLFQDTVSRELAKISPAPLTAYC